MARYFFVLFLILSFLYLNRSYAYFYDFQGDNFIPNPKYSPTHLINKDSKAETKKVVMLGDSLLAGTGSSSEENGMAYLIALHLTDKKNVELLNPAKPGVGIMDVLNRQVPEAIKENPDYIFLMIGTNDVHNRVSAGDFRENYEKILQQITTQTKAKITIINIPVIGSQRILYPLWRQALNFRIDEFNKIIKESAEKFNLPVIDLKREFEREFEEGSDLYSEDQFHPSDKGYGLWAEYINSQLKNY